MPARSPRVTLVHGAERALPRPGCFAAACCLALSGLAACAPIASLRPASGVLPERSTEVGAAIARLGPRPYVEESSQLVGQLWLSHEPSRHFSLSVLAAFDDSAAAGGVAARWNAVRTDRFAFGPEAEAGYAWGAASLGFALRTVGQNWLYASPRVGNLGFDWAFGIPVGASLDLTHGFVLRSELQVSWVDLKYYNRRVHLAGGLVYQW